MAHLLRTLVFSALVLGFVFGFDDKQPTFVFEQWVANMLLIALSAFVVLLVFALIELWAARRTDNEATITLWSITRYGLRRAAEVRYKAPIGVILAVIAAILSNGAAKIAAVVQTDITTDEAKRTGRKFRRGTEYEAALVCASGPWAAMLLSVAAKALLPPGVFTQGLIDVGRYLAVFTMIPLPNLNGLKVYFGSPLLFSSTLLFAILSFILLPVLPAGLALGTAIVLALIFFFLHYYYGFIKAGN